MRWVVFSIRSGSFNISIFESYIERFSLEILFFKFFFKPSIFFSKIDIEFFNLFISSIGLFDDFFLIAEILFFLIKKISPISIPGDAPIPFILLWFKN